MWGRSSVKREITRTSCLSRGPVSGRFFLRQVNRKFAQVKSQGQDLEKMAGNGATHEYLCYASCYAHFGEYEKAMEPGDWLDRDRTA